MAEPIRTPGRGAYLAGKFYQGGEPIPDEVMDSLDPSTRHSLEDAARRDAGTADQRFAGRHAVPESPEKDSLSVAETKKGLSHPDAKRKDIPVYGESLKRPRQTKKLKDTTPFGTRDEKRSALGDLGPHLRDDELDRLHKRHADQLVHLFGQLPSVEQHAAVANLGKIKRGWYDAAAEGLATVFGHESPRFVALLAATSPRKSVQDNFIKSLNIWRWYRDRVGGLSERQRDSVTPQMVRRWINEARESGEWSKIVGGDKLMLSGDDNNTARALGSTEEQLLNTGFKSLLSGMKVDSFRSNLAGEAGPVTSDTWESVLQNVHQGILSRVPGYLALAAHKRATAEYLNQHLSRGEKPWTPAAVQAATWSVVRTLAFIGGMSRTASPRHPAGVHAKDIAGGIPIGPTGALGALDHLALAGTVDFMDLLNDDKDIQRLVASLGPEYRKGLKRFREEYAANPPEWRRERSLQGKPETAGGVDLEPVARSAGRKIGGFVGNKIPNACRGRRVRYSSLGNIRSMAKRISQLMERMYPRLVARWRDFEDERDTNARSRRGGRRPQRGVPGKPSRVRQSRRRYAAGDVGGAVFASNNTGSDMSFDDAHKASVSANAKSFVQQVNDVFKRAGLNPVRSRSAVGDWVDGAEHSTVHVVERPSDPDAIRYAAAWSGLLGNRKSVLWFHSDDGGPDSVYHVTVPETDLSKVRTSLDNAGVRFRTLIPGRRGTTVVYYDAGRASRNQFLQFAASHNATIRESTGRGGYIGSERWDSPDARTRARAAYRKIIAEYEARRGTEGRPGEAAAEHGVHGEPERERAGSAGTADAGRAGVVAKRQRRRSATRSATGPSASRRKASPVR